MKQIDDAISYFNWLILDEFQDIKCWIAGGAVRDYFSFGKLIMTLYCLISNSLAFCPIAVKVS